MRKIFLQPLRNLIVYGGCILIPALLFLPLLIVRDPEFNITGVLDDPVYGILGKAIACIMLAWLSYILYSFRYPEITPVKQSLHIILVLFALFTGYQTDSLLIRNLHLVFAYAAFIIQNLLFLQVFRRYPKYGQIYLAVCVFCVLHCFTYGVVTGLSESLYASASTVLLTLCLRNEYKEKRR